MDPLIRRSEHADFQSNAARSWAERLEQIPRGTSPTGSKASSPPRRG
ncbi:hypothetical protein SALCHL_000054 [Streptomyces albus subsp. chlorinus]